MEDQRSVNSPRTLSFSKNRKATGSLSRPSFARNDNTSGFGISGEHGPKLSEVYGFVGSISSVVATVIFLVWSYAPDSWLHSIGISYYPSRYWALAVPAYLMVTVVLAVVLYIGLNFMGSPSPTCFNTMFDACSKDPVNSIPSIDDDEQPIEPISDIGINLINDIMFNNFATFFSAFFSFSLFYAVNNSCINYGKVGPFSKPIPCPVLAVIPTFML